MGIGICYALPSNCYDQGHVTICPIEGPCGPLVLSFRLACPLGLAHLFLSFQAMTMARAMSPSAPMKGHEANCPFEGFFGACPWASAFVICCQVILWPGKCHVIIHPFEGPCGHLALFFCLACPWGLAFVLILPSYGHGQGHVTVCHHEGP
jgi:hypothetical protein